MKITFVVILAHLLLFSVLVMQPKTPKPRERCPVTVRTHVLAKQKEDATCDEPLASTKPTHLEPTPTPKPRHTPPPRQTLEPEGTREPKPTPTPTQKQSKQILSQKEESKKTKSSKCVESSEPKHTQREKLISLMKQSLTALNDTSTSTPKGKDPPTRLNTLGKLKSETLSTESLYETELIGYMESLLCLPEKGKVKISLTLNRDGVLQELKILEASSLKNRHYIETMLPALSFPAFGVRFKNELSHTFAIMLTSENLR
jgi:hypothetical protein